MTYYRYPLYHYPPSINSFAKYQNSKSTNVIHYPSNTSLKKQTENSTNKQFQNEINATRTLEKESSKKANEDTLFEIFGIKMHFDDILLICLIFFLYNEGVQDQFLFIALILLLLS